MADGVQLLGEKELNRLLKSLGDRVQRKVLRQAVNAGCTPVVKAARQKARKQSGLLRKSLNKKLKTYPDKMTVVGIVGPRTSVVGEFEGKKRWPAKYAHLQERGFIDESGKFIPPQPFLGPAMESTEGQALGIMRDKLAAGVLKEASQND